MAPTDELSTSARLREAQGALAASQADLTRVERQYAETRGQLRQARMRLSEIDGELHSARLERDGVREELARQAATCEDLAATLAMRTGQLTASRRHVNEAKRDRDLARAELASACQELDTLRIQLAGVVQFASAYDGSERSWQVARQDVGPCGLCAQPIVRGQAVEPKPGAAGYFQHAAGLCPDKETT